MLPLRKKMSLKHVALQCNNVEKTMVFYKKVLELELLKTFTLTKVLSKQIFNVEEQVQAYVFGNRDIVFEIFITKKPLDHGFEHVCIEVDNQEDFVKHCRMYGVKPLFIERNGKTLLFIKDFSGNLFEVKEKKKDVKETGEK
ncbi:MAG: hypothetical protein DRN24_00420 [Thermoplasmata archaeon]|nr:MAG: hypothetical protein DRN24_00420 [Thermoplasmata archaeon]